MPEPTTATPPAAPANPPTPPAPAVPPAAPPPADLNPEDQPLLNPFDPENNADHKIKDLIAGREQRKAKSLTGEPNPSAAPAAAPTATPAAQPPKPIGELISGALKFRPKKEAPAAPAAPAAAPAAAAPAPTPPPPEKKPKRQAQPTQPVIDTNRIAEAAASAAATAAVTAVQGSAPRAASPESAIVAQMTDEEKYEYELAQFMATSYPHLKGADSKFLDNFRRTEVYKRNWESANPGKQFDPEDEDHDAHFATVQKPWKDYEYHEAIADRKAVAREKKQDEHTSKELKRLEQQNARLELAPVIDDTLTNAFGAVLKGYDEETFKGAAQPGFWDNLAKKNPTAARHLAGSVQEMKPLVEAIIQIDDPRARTPIDLSIPAHKRWADHLISTEAKYAGTVDDSGRTFATRADFVRMPPAQQARHYYLTTENLLQELVDTTVDSVKTRIDSDVQRIRAEAEAMGWAPPATDGGASHAPNGLPIAAPINTAPSTEKPISPPSGSSTKNDVKDPQGGGGVAGVVAAASKALFGR